MKTILWLYGSNRKTAAIRITRNEGKRDLARSLTRRDGSETGCSVGFFFPKGALTHHLRNAQHFAGGGIPPDGRAVRSARHASASLRCPRGTRGVSFSAENDGRFGRCSSRPRRAAFPSLRDQPAGWSWQSVFPSEMQPACLPNLPQRKARPSGAAGSANGNGLPQLLRSFATTERRTMK